MEGKRIQRPFWVRHFHWPYCTRFEACSFASPQILMNAYSRLNLCSHSSTAAKEIEDTHGQCDAECWRQFFLPNPTKGSICKGDRGATLMAKERGRWHASFHNMWPFFVPLSKWLPCVFLQIKFNFSWYYYIYKIIKNTCIIYIFLWIFKWIFKLQIHSGWSVQQMRA